MTTYRYKRIAVKVGSNVLTQKDGTLDLTRMSAIVDQVVLLQKAGIEVILISSGAVASGKSLVKTSRKLDAVDQRQLFSAVGQVILINRYYHLFHQKGLTCGQVLTTKESFSSRRHYLNQKNCMTVMLENGVIPVVNENDTISVTELMFTDNDELSGLIATMMDVEALFILSNIDGIYNGVPSDPKAQVIREIRPEVDIKQYIVDEKSSFGRGGMLTKCNIARKVAEEGIPVIIANGKKENILTDLLDESQDVVCTRFLPTKKASAVKKWIAHSDGFAKGEIHINEGCLFALNQKATSVLPVGITRIEGNFERGDIVSIFDASGNQVGVGKAQYSSVTARDVIGKKGERPLIHYDYLFLD
ncbi:MAG TPA: glutamate 5-kinase [Bacteroidales bacterium]|nr:glutamate 5-kinase [Bacteroidales bacterium]